MKRPDAYLLRNNALPAYHHIISLRVAKQLDKKAQGMYNIWRNYFLELSLFLPASESRERLWRTSQELILCVLSRYFTNHVLIWG